MEAPGPALPLTPSGLRTAVDELVGRDPDLAGIVARFGYPPLWDRTPGFSTLVHIVLEQQVSLASSLAAFERLAGAVMPLTPARFLALSDAELFAIGFSRQKTRYVRALARAVESGALDLPALGGLDDDAVHAALQSIRGIGPWTSTIYLLMVLGRPDVWPVGDIALAASVGEVKRLGHRPDVMEVAELADGWRPWRSVAARLFWHHYLSRRGRSR